MEELIDRLSESASSRTTLEGRLCLLEAASLAAQEEVAGVLQCGTYVWRSHCATSTSFHYDSIP